MMPGFRSALIAPLAGAIALASCQTTDLDRSTAGVANRDLLGGALGAVGGYLACKGLDGNDTVCALAAVGGAAAGIVIARRMKPEDRAPRAVALAQVVEGQAAARQWRSSESGSSGEIRLVSQSQSADGRPCRTVEETYTIRGESAVTEQYRLCQAVSGEWKDAPR
jgi:hypothetical protein